MTSSAPAAAPAEDYSLRNPNPDPSPEDIKRRERTARAWKAYRGEFPPTFKVEPGKPNRNIAPNRCAAIVDKGVAWLFGQPIELDVRDAATDDLDDEDERGQGQGGLRPASPDTDKAQSALAKVWGTADDMLTMLTGAAMNGAMDGQAYLKIVWDSEKMDVPRLQTLDSANVYCITDPDDCNRAVCYVVEYRANLGIAGNYTQPRYITKRQVICCVDPDGDARLLGGYDDDDTWQITNYIRMDQQGLAVGSMQSQNQQPWRQVGATIDWPYPFPPIVDCMNLPNPNEYCGLPDLPPAIIDLNQQIQFIESNLAKIIESNAHPWVFASGVDPSAIKNEPGIVQGLPSVDSKVFAMTATGDLASSMNFASSLRADMDEQSRVPAVALGRQEELPKGNISGVALALLFQPLIEKTELKRRLYGHLIREASVRCLVLMDIIKDCDDVDIFIKWPNLLPVDDLAAAQTAQLLLSMGIPKKDVFKQLGYDPEEAMEQKRIEDAADMVSQSRGQAPINLKAMQQQRNAQAQRQATMPGALGQATPNGTPPTPTLQPSSTMMQAQAAPMGQSAAGQ